MGLSRDYFCLLVILYGWHGSLQLLSEIHRLYDCILLFKNMS